MHFAPGKAAIIRSPGDWIAHVEPAVVGGIAVARAFWTATSEGMPYPTYLDDLDMDKLLGEAEKRIAATAPARQP